MGGKHARVGGGRGPGYDLSAAEQGASPVPRASPAGLTPGAEPSPETTSSPRICPPQAHDRGSYRSCYQQEQAGPATL